MFYTATVAVIYDDPVFVQTLPHCRKIKAKIINIYNNSTKRRACGLYSKINQMKQYKQIHFH